MGVLTGIYVIEEVLVFIIVSEMESTIEPPKSLESIVIISSVRSTAYPIHFHTDKSIHHLKCVATESISAMLVSGCYYLNPFLLQNYYLKIPILTL